MFVLSLQKYASITKQIAEGVKLHYWPNHPTGMFSWRKWIFLQ